MFRAAWGEGKHCSKPRQSVPLNGVQGTTLIPHTEQTCIGHDGPCFLFSPDLAFGVVANRLTKTLPCVGMSLQ